MFPSLRSFAFGFRSTRLLHFSVSKKSYGSSQDWHWATASSSANNVREAVKQCCDSLKSKIPDVVGPNSTAAVFVWGSQYRTEAAKTIPQLIVSEGLSSARNIFGCTTHLGLLGVKSIYRRCALTITVASLPNISISPFHCTTPSVPTISDIDIAKYHEPENCKNTALFMMVNRANGFDDEKFLSRLDVAFPYTPKFGPIWGKRGGEADIVFINGDCVPGGAVGMFLEGPFKVDTFQSNGFFPLGAPFSITGAEGRDIWSLNSSPSVEALTSRLRSFGFASVNYTPLLARVIPNNSANVRPSPVRVLPWNDDKSQIRVAESVASGDQIQFYFYDYKPVLADIGNQLESYKLPKGISDKSQLGVLGFSSLLDPSSLDDLCAPVEESFNLSFFPITISDSKGNTIGQQAEIRPKIIMKRVSSSVDTDAESAEDNSIFDQSFDDIDYYDDPDEFKEDLERAVIDLQKFSNVSGPLTSSILISENNHSYSVPGAAQFVVFAPDDSEGQ